MIDESPESLIEGRCAYEGRILRLEVDRVRLADGFETVREVVRHPGAAVIVPLCGDGRLLFVRQFRYPVGRTLLELPAGKRDGREDPLECAKRELAEETGNAARIWRLLASFYTAPGFTDELIHCFLACGLDRVALTANLGDDDERIDVVALTPGEARRCIESGEICDAKTIVGVLLAEGVTGKPMAGAECGEDSGAR